jgi:hypothetical protein
MLQRLLPAVSVAPDVRRAFAALTASAAGTMAGILADSGFGLRASVINVAYRLLQPLFDVFAAYPNGQLVVADFIHRIPLVLVIGLSAGLILRHMHYRGLLLCSILVWPVCRAVGKTALVPGDGAALLRIQVLPEMALYTMQYSLLFLTVYATHALVLRPGRKGFRPV